jgi:hypothetical protein
LIESGTPLLAVSIPDEGKGQALFLAKDAAAHVVKGCIKRVANKIDRRTLGAHDSKRLSENGDSP